MTGRDRVQDPSPSYAGRVAALATRHDKLPLIAPALAVVGLEVIVADVDTDVFGTFTGEIPRRADAVVTAERKARAAMAASGADAGLGSEGSFGPHPDVPWLTVDLELVLLVDERLEVVVYEQALATDTAAASMTVSADSDGEELEQFCRRVGFPDQALICRPADGTTAQISKAVVTSGALREAFRRAAGASSDGRAIVETDLRAHLCPTRRPVINQAAVRLASRLTRRCPSCTLPGFGHTTFEPGLPCRLCGLPTTQPGARIESCPACLHQDRHPILGSADAAGCSYCNP